MPWSQAEERETGEKFERFRRDGKLLPKNHRGRRRTRRRRNQCELLIMAAAEEISYYSISCDELWEIR